MRVLIKAGPLVLAGLLGSASGVLAQDSGADTGDGAPGGPAGDETGFTRTGIPADVDATFRCVRADGGTLVELDDVASIVPDRIRGVMTFSVATRDGRTRVLYLGQTTDCVLAVARKR
mgnify:CR=1 FL=1